MKYAAYSEYKPSGAEWLGDVPKHWTIKAIKWESPVKRGASPRPIDDPVYFDDEGEYAWVRISDVTDAGTYLEKTEQRLSPEGDVLSVKLNPGDIFLSIAGSVGKACISRIKCCIHDGFVHFPRWKSDPKFLYYIFASGEPYKGLGKMGTQLNLNTDTVGSIVIGFPVLEEQVEITCFLDAKTAQIDALIDKKRSLIETLKEKRSALISRVVTRGLPPEAAKAAGLDPNPEMKDSGVEWLGQIPVHWETRPLYARYSVELGKMLSEARITGECLLPYLRNVDVQWNCINFDGLLEMDIHPSEYPRYTIRSGDLLVCEGGEVGRAAIVGSIDGLIGYQKALHRLRALKGDECQQYMCFVFEWAARTGIFNAGGVSTIAHLTGEQLRKYRFPKPPVFEQEKIASYLAVESSSIDALIDEIETVIDRLTEYRQSLITAAVTGKIDVRRIAA
jgi:type I restriction enzyme, S subunit